jgi:Lrp/AsnC family leucine-responsive transcriptional regulator
MEPVDLDNVDRCILHALQEDARTVSASTIAERLDVSARTVRNRIDRLEEAGVIRGYRLDVDYESAGYQLHTMVVCTAPVSKREEIAREVLEVPGVIAVQEIMTGDENLNVEVVGIDGDDLSRITRDLNDLGLEINDEDIIRNEYYRAYHEFDRFGTKSAHDVE